MSLLALKAMAELTDMIANDNIKTTDLVRAEFSGDGKIRTLALPNMLAFSLLFLASAA
jgi:hypothetical protein